MCYILLIDMAGRWRGYFKRAESVEVEGNEK
jgi:hypothetical protein